jgi:hypothetical protein
VHDGLALLLLRGVVVRRLPIGRKQRVDGFSAAKGPRKKGGVGRVADAHFDSGAPEFRELALRSAERADLLAGFA